MFKDSANYLFLFRFVSTLRLSLFFKTVNNYLSVLSKLKENVMNLSV